MSTQPTQPALPQTPATSDALVLQLVRAGVAADVIYATLWPDPARRPVTYADFAAIVQAIEVADATSAPAEELPQDLEDVVDDLLLARRKIMSALEQSGDVGEDGHFDAGPHMALVKNADTLLKYQAARQERQVHRLNLRVAREKARLELLDLYATSRGGSVGNN